MPSRTPTAVVVIAERARLGMTQAELAAHLIEVTEDTSWSRNKVRRIESGEQVINVEVLQALSKALDLDYATLIDGYTRRSRGDVTVRYNRRASDQPVHDGSDAIEAVPALLAA